MPRVKRGVPAAKRRKRILKRAKGYSGGRSKLHSVAVEAENGLSYSRFMAGLKDAGIEVDRKVLAQLALEDPKSFAALAEQAKGSA